MSLRVVALVGAIGLGVLPISGVYPVPGSNTAPGKVFTYAFQGDLNSLDPYTLNETFTLGTLGNVMEGLVRRDKSLKIVPALAESWETLEPTRWRFHLRKGVKFHDGSPFSADDVVFSAERVHQPGSQLKTRIPPGTKVVKIDDYTVDFILPTPNPILISEWETWFILSKRWAEAHEATLVQAATATSLSPFALQANGTGPFMIVKHEPGVRTVFRSNPNWWGKHEGNLDQVVLQTVQTDSTRVAALLAGDVDMIDPVPVQDIDRVNAGANVKVLAGPELRTIFLNMDSMRDELLYSDVKGKNPFKDVRVRRAFYEAIDINTIDSKIMHGMATPTALLISPLLFPRGSSLQRWPYDVAEARKLMSEAGYPNGFSLVMDCPNDRYVNDAEICQAVAAMLSKINVKVTVNALPKSKYFEKAGPTRKYDSSFNLVGWTPGSLDSLNVLVNTVICRDKDGKGGTFNFGGYCNPRIDALAQKIRVETDTGKRDELIAEAYQILHDDAGMIPLHQQSLAWGVSKDIDLVQRADGQLRFDWITKH
ncbi:MAG TPA: ABC transporter substrate-binding protein [Hyphomicrobiaceae bacterium]|nr:ABC transporter substrate-binding protein [Hyphomicrobiaceae bacterium]